MKALKTVLYIVYVLLIVATIGLILYDNTILSSLGIENGPAFWKAYLTAILAVFVIALIIENMHIAKLRKEVDAMNREVNDVKVKFFDEVIRRKEGGMASPNTVRPVASDQVSPSPAPPVQEDSRVKIRTENGRRL